MVNLDIKNNYELCDRSDWTHTQIRISDLIYMILDNQVFIPRIIRPNVWNREKIKLLVISLFKRIPIGVLIMWELPNERLDIIQYYKIIKEAAEVPDLVYLILDGLQRCITISTVFSSEEIITDEKFHDIDLYYNFIKDEFKFKEEIKEFDDTWINLKDTYILRGDKSQPLKLFIKKISDILAKVNREDYDSVHERIERIFGIVMQSVTVSNYRGYSSNFALDITKNFNSLSYYGED